ncbi:translation initiation factor IF-2 N-terminal domain-containing protein [Chloracidobacterium sp. 2]|nr:translation initiation factor IF-2 N-terminal domain-containing protein [Chloracidobacterium sp. 2]
MTTKIRIYELAKELKVDSKRIIEDLQRIGVSGGYVPSSSIDQAVANRIRERYNPNRASTDTPFSQPASSSSCRQEPFCPTSHRPPSPPPSQPARRSPNRPPALPASGSSSMDPKQVCQWRARHAKPRRRPHPRNHCLFRR